MRSKKTRRAIRQLARDARDRAKPPDPVLNGIPVPSEDAGSGSSAIPTAELVEEALDVSSVPLSQAETAALPAIPTSSQNDPNAETEGGTDPGMRTDGPPEPPRKLGFSCPCGAILTAPRELYDKRMFCKSCGEVLLLNLLYKADLQRFEIYPLRATPEA